jgi:hypothetical protein
MPKGMVFELMGDKVFLKQPLKLLDNEMTNKLKKRLTYNNMTKTFLMSFSIAKNLLALNTRATNLGISSWATTITTRNNLKTLRMGPWV